MILFTQTRSSTGFTKPLSKRGSFTKLQQESSASHGGTDDLVLMMEYPTQLRGLLDAVAAVLQVGDPMVPTTSVTSLAR